MGAEIIFHLIRFAGLYLNVYSVAMLVLMIFYFFVQQSCKNEFCNWLYACNSIVLWISLGYLFVYAGELFVAWYGQNPYGWYAFKQNGIHTVNPYGWSYWLFFIGCNILPQLLWFKKLRASFLMTFVVILFLNAGAWFERLVIWITSYYRDYLPSSWSTYTENSYLADLLLGLVYFFLLSFAVYWLLHKRKELPFQSAIFAAKP